MRDYDKRKEAATAKAAGRAHSQRPPTNSGGVRTIYQGRIVHLNLETVKLPTGVTTELEIVRHPGAAAVAAVDESSAILLLRQYRYAAGGTLWEVPAGTLEPGENPSECAARELREEAGVEAGEISPLGVILTCPGFCDERIHLFLATRLTAAEQSLDRDEVIEEVVRVPLREALRMINEGTIRDAKSIAAVYRACSQLRVC